MRELPILMNGAMVRVPAGDRNKDADLAALRRFREYLADRRREKWLRNSARRKVRGKQHVDGGRASSGDKG